jgi:adenylate cyclase
MSVEIEHKYLVLNEPWDAIAKPEGFRIKQGYILNQPGKTIRLRVKGDEGFITIKGPAVEASRLEYEYPIPVTDALELLGTFAGQCIEKIRYNIIYKGNRWEVDEFLGDNEGLLLAEIELKNADEVYQKPPWAGENVTRDPRYYNSYLAVKPFKTW